MKKVIYPSKMFGSHMYWLKCYERQCECIIFFIALSYNAFNDLLHLLVLYISATKENLKKYYYKTLLCISRVIPLP